MLHILEDAVHSPIPLLSHEAEHRIHDKNQDFSALFFTLLDPVVVSVLEDYQQLLLLPLHAEPARFTLEQLHACASTARFLHVIDRHNPAWRIQLPSLCQKVLSRTRYVTARTSYLLGTDVSHQRRLHRSLVTVTRAEQRDECSLRNR